MLLGSRRRSKGEFGVFFFLLLFFPQDEKPLLGFAHQVGGDNRLCQIFCDVESQEFDVVDSFYLLTIYCGGEEVSFSCRVK